MSTGKHLMGAVSIVSIVFAALLTGASASEAVAAPVDAMDTVNTADTIDTVNTIVITDPVTPDGESGWFRSPPLVTVSPVTPDIFSYYSWSGATGPWQAYAAPFPMPGEGAWELFYFSTQDSGDAEAGATLDAGVVGSRSMSLDATAPKAWVAVAGRPWFTNDRTFTLRLASSDPGGIKASGVRGVSLTGPGVWKGWRSPSTSLRYRYRSTRNGRVRLTMTVKDVAGNLSPAAKAGFFFDDHPPYAPRLHAPRRTKPYTSGKRKGRGAFTVRLSGRDRPDGSGRGYFELQYRTPRGDLAGGKWLRYARTKKTRLRFEGRAGRRYQLRVRTVDRAGNKGRFSKVRPARVAAMAGTGWVYFSGGDAGGPRRKTIALTFDDGPSGATSRILSTLRRQKVHASFFVLGSQARYAPGTLRSMVAEGHTVGNHSWNHGFLSGWSSGSAASDIARTSRVIERADTDVRWFRPPYGGLSSRLRRASARQEVDIAMWDVDPKDWSGRSASSIAAHVIGHAHRGAIVVMHDGGGNGGSTAAALPSIIRNLKARGYRIVSLDEMFAR